MPLVSTSLKSELEKFFDPDSPNFEGFPDPENFQDVVDKWSGAVDNYASQVVPVSVNAVAAKAAFAAVIATINSDAQNGPVQLVAAFTAYAAQLALGMQPAFTGTPPITPIVLDSVYAIGLSTGSNGDCLNELVSLIDSWFKTGTAINNVSGATVNWT